MEINKIPPQKITKLKKVRNSKSNVMKVLQKKIK